MTKKKADTRLLKAKFKGEGTMTPKQEKPSGFPLGAKPGLPRKNGDKTAAKKLTAASTTELADAELSDTDPEIWFMEFYYGPPSNSNDDFLLWGTQKSSDGRFNADPILDFMNTPNSSHPLVANETDRAKQSPAGERPRAKGLKHSRL